MKPTKTIFKNLFLVVLTLSTIYAWARYYEFSQAYGHLIEYKEREYSRYLESREKFIQDQKIVSDVALDDLNYTAYWQINKLRCKELHNPFIWVSCVISEKEDYESKNYLIQVVDSDRLSREKFAIDNFPSSFKLSNDELVGTSQVAQNVPAKSTIKSTVSINFNGMLSDLDQGIFWLDHASKLAGDTFFCKSSTPDPITFETPRNHFNSAIIKANAVNSNISDLQRNIVDHVKDVGSKGVTLVNSYESDCEEYFETGDVEKWNSEVEKDNRRTDELISEIEELRNLLKAL